MTLNNGLDIDLRLHKNLMNFIICNDKQQFYHDIALTAKLYVLEFLLAKHKQFEMSTKKSAELFNLFTRY